MFDVKCCRRNRAHLEELAAAWIMTATILSFTSVFRSMSWEYLVVNTCQRQNIHTVSTPVLGVSDIIQRILVEQIFQS